MGIDDVVTTSEDNEIGPTDLFPDPPQFSAEVIEECRRRRDFRVIFFEWYRFVANLAITTAHLKYESPVFGEIPRRNYHVLAGSVNRIARLMVASVALSHEGKFGEATDILHRCIFETSVTIIWLSQNASDANFDRFMASGVRGDRELRSHIVARVQSGDGRSQALENRMLDSIERTLQSTEMSEEALASSPPLPDLASMMSAVGWDRLMYVTAQKMGSHHVHGTWTGLITQYLTREGEAFVPGASPRPAHSQGYAFVSVMALSALEAYIGYALQEGAERTTLMELYRSVRDEIQNQFKEAGDDPLV